MLSFSQSQMRDLREQRIASFLQRAHEHQCRVGFVDANIEFQPRKQLLRDLFEFALAHGFKEERHLMFVMDCTFLFGKRSVSKRLSERTGPPEERADALMSLG